MIDQAYKEIEFSRSVVSQCTDTYYNHSGRRGRGKLTSRIYWIYNEWTIVVKNQKKTVFWFDYEADLLGYEGTLTTQLCISGSCATQVHSYDEEYTNTRREQDVVFHNFGAAIQANEISFEGYNMEFYVEDDYNGQAQPRAQCNLVKL